jgi:DNA-binding beta-propeller fold protein YncE
MRAHAMLLVVLLTGGRALAAEPPTVPVQIPSGEGGIGFDDLVFAPVLRRVLVPAGRTGRLDLIDPDTREIASIGGFSKSEGFGGGHGEGTTSADEGRGLLFASDRSRRTLVVLDPKSRSAIASVKLAAGPDYVRWVAPLGEVWVTEPSSEQIECFHVAAKGPPSLVATIHVADGPESLVIDAAHGRAYTHLWRGSTAAIDLQTHAVAARWKNGCDGSRGIALDAERALLFAGCDEGRATAMDLNRKGEIVSTATTGNGVDVIAYSPQLGHLYVPGEVSATLTVLGVDQGGKLAPLTSFATAKGSHCVAADDRGGAWICDPKGGRLLYFHDTLPPSR